MVRKLLLDDLLPEKSVVVLDGQEHPIEAQSTEAWLRIMQLQEKVWALDEKREDADDAAGYAELMLNTMVDVAVAACPTLSEERLRRLPFVALAALTEVIGKEASMGMPSRDEDVGGEADAKGEPEGEAQAETAED